MRALALEPAACPEAWRAWLAGRSIDALLPRETVLLPLAYRRLEAGGDLVPDLARLRGIHRFHWSRNQLLVAALGRLLPRLRDPVLAGPVAIALTRYPDAGCRPLEGADVIVAEAHADAARRALAGEREAARVRIHASRRHGEIAAFAVPFEVAGVPARALAAEDVLVEACVAWNGGRGPIGAALDACVLAAGGIDWPAAVAAAARRRAIRSLRALARRFGAPVPPSAVAALEREVASLAVEIAHAALRRLRRAR